MDLRRRSGGVRMHKSTQLSFKLVSKSLVMNQLEKSLGIRRPVTSGGARHWPLPNKFRYISLVTATMRSSRATAADLRGMSSTRSISRRRVAIIRVSVGSMRRTGTRSRLRSLGRKKPDAPVASAFLFCATRAVVSREKLNYPHTSPKRWCSRGEHGR